MNAERTYRFLFVMWLAEGMETVFHNLRKAVGKMEEIEPYWVTIDLNPENQRHLAPLTRVPPFSRSWTLQQGLITRQLVYALERSGKEFDAAYFTGAPLAFFLRAFRKRIPSVDGLDATPRNLINLGYYVPTAQGMWAIEWLRNHLARRAFESSALLLPCSHFAKNSLMTDYGIAEERIHVVPTGIDLDVWKGRCERPSPDLDRRPQILFVGGNFKRKGGDLLLRIAAREQFKACDFHFVTRTFEGTPSPNVFLYDNLQPNSEPLFNLYKKADVFVLPTRADVYSLANLEAMAMELPVLTTSVGGVGEIVVDGEDGFIVPVDAEDLLANRLALLMNDPALRHRCGQNGRRRVVSTYGLTTYAQAIIDHLKWASQLRKR